MAETYRYGNLQIEVLPKFLYEVDISKISKDVSAMLSDRYYTSDELLNAPETTVIKRFNSFMLVRFITLLGAPLSFIQENNLQPYTLLKK